MKKNSSHVKNKSCQEAVLYSGGSVYCTAQALTAWWRLGLSGKSGRLVSAWRRLEASGGFLPPVIT